MNCRALTTRQGTRRVTPATLIVRFMRPTWDPPGADRTQVGPCGPHENCYLGMDVGWYASVNETNLKNICIFSYIFPIQWFIQKKIKKIKRSSLVTWHSSLRHPDYAMNIFWGLSKLVDILMDTQSNVFSWKQCLYLYSHYIRLCLGYID